MQISPEKVVSVVYTLTLNNGAIADQADETQPFAFIHGIGQTLPAFDDALAGLVAGDEFNFSLTADDAYGMPNTDWVIDIPRSVFDGPDVPSDILVIGAVLPMQDQNGNRAAAGKEIVTSAYFSKLQAANPSLQEKDYFIMDKIQVNT